MHHRHLPLVALADRHVRRQPVNQPVHRVDRFGAGGEVLLASAADLAIEIAARPAEAGQARGVDVDGVQRGDDAVHLAVDSSPAGAFETRQRLLPNTRPLMSSIT